MEEQFRARAYRSVSKTQKPDSEAGPWTEPVEGVDWAETWLLENGTPEESFVDLYFNGDEGIHTSVYYIQARQGLQEPIFGLANSEHARWPVWFIGEGPDQIDPNSDIFGRDLAEWKPGDDDEDEIDEDADVLDLGNEKPEGDDNEGDDEEDDEDESEEEDGEDEEIDEDSDVGGRNDEADSDGDDEEEVPEMPRLTIFGKMRGPKGWRKRAETEESNIVNRFGFKVGVLDPDADTTRRQERDTLVEVRFTEFDSNRTHGELRLLVPEGVEFTKKGRYFIAQVPYHEEDEK